MTNEYGEIFETTLDAKKLDSKGRRIGFTVKLRNNGENFRAWVQNSRMVDGEWVNFGASQYHKNFDNQAKAKEWAYAAAKARIAKLGA